VREGFPATPESPERTLAQHRDRSRLRVLKGYTSMENHVGPRHELVLGNKGFPLRIIIVLKIHL
jgi:hypothetical protein